MKFTAKQRKFIGIELKGTRGQIRKLIKKNTVNGLVQFSINKGDLCYASIKIKSNRWYTTFLKRICIPAILTVGEQYELKPNLKGLRVQIKYMKESNFTFIIKNSKVVKLNNHYSPL